MNGNFGKFYFYVFLLFTLSFLLFPVNSFFARPVIDVAIRVYAPDNVLKTVSESAIFPEIVDSKRFEVALQNALKLLYSELWLQDLLSSAEQILSKQTSPQGTFQIDVHVQQIRKENVYKEFIQNNISGDYIYNFGDYIRVYPGVRYKLEYVNGKENYVQSSEGSYVKGVDGKYYSVIFDSFYSRVPHTNVVYIVEGNADYSLYINNNKALSGSFEISSSIYAVKHSYDPYNNRLLRVENSFNDVISGLASDIASKLHSVLEFKEKLSGVVEEVKFPRVILNIGEDDFVKVGKFFSVYRNNNKIAEVVVRRTGKDYSECEVVYIKRGEEIKPQDEVKEGGQEPFPMGFKMLFITDQSFSLPESYILLTLPIKQFNIHREPISYFETGVGLNLESIINGTYDKFIFTFSGLIRLIGTGNDGLYLLSKLSITVSETILDERKIETLLGLSTKFGLLNFEFSIPIEQLTSFNTFRIGGGVSW